MLKQLARSRTSSRTEVSACPACGSPERLFLFHTTDRLYRTALGEYEVARCGKCGLMRTDPHPPVDIHSNSVSGDTLAGRLERGYSKLVARDHVNFIRRAIGDAGPPAAVADAGARGGLVCEVLGEQGIKVGSGAVAPGSCAAVLMLDFLEHAGDPYAEVMTAQALLRPGGRLIVQVPNAACWQFLLLGEKWAGLDVPRRFIHYRAGDLTGLLEACGFEIVQRKDFVLRDNPALLATSLAPALDPRVRRARGIREAPSLQFAKTLAYIFLVMFCIPFAALGACCRAGSTILVEARRRT